MDANYPYPVLVEGEWDPTFPNLKNKLNIYFQSKKSNGGDCHVQFRVADGRRATVWFKTEQVRNSVLAKSTHGIKLGQRNLVLTCRLPDNGDGAMARPFEASGAKGPAAQEEPVAKEPVAKKPMRQLQDEEQEPKECPLASPSVVLEKVEGLSQEHLEMLVENIMKGHITSSSDFTLEVLAETSQAVVTFNDAQNAKKFCNISSTKKSFTGKNYTARVLEVPMRVRAEDLSREINSDYLQLYFNVTEDVDMLEEEQSAIITFSDPTEVTRVIQREHSIRNIGKPFKVFPYYDSLGTALYGKDKPVLKLPVGFEEDIDPVLLKCLQEHPEHAEWIQTEMIKLFSTVDLKALPIQVSPTPSLLQQKKQTPKLVRSWRANATSGLKGLLSTFTCLRLNVPSLAWAEAELAIREVIAQKKVTLVLDRQREQIVLAGLAETVKQLPDMNKTVQIITQRVNREAASLYEEVPVASTIYHLLEYTGHIDKIVKDHPELKLTFNKSSQKLTFQGLKEEILMAKNSILEEELMFSQNKQLLNVDDSITQFLCKAKPDNLTETLFLSQRISAALQMQNNMVYILAKTLETQREAQQQLQKTLTHLCIEIEDLNILNMTEWQELVEGLMLSLNQERHAVTVQIDGQLVILSGFIEAVEKMHQQLQEFVYERSSTTKSVQADRIIIKYIHDMTADVWKDMSREDVKVDFGEDSVTLCGPRASVMQCSDTMNGLISSVHQDVLRVVRPGARKCFTDKDALYVRSVWNCLVQLDSGGEVAAKAKPVLTLQTPQGVEISVFQADLCSFKADAVVNAANETLKHDGGLAGALLEAAGPQLQDECDKLVAYNGFLRPGEAVLTAAGGRLQCQHVIHAVGPRFSSANPQGSIALLTKAIMASLGQAESLSLHSLAIPAVSSGVFGFPLEVCAETIVEAIKIHCEATHHDGSLKKIHLVNKDDGAVQALARATRKAFDRPAHQPPQAQRQPDPAQRQGPRQPSIHQGNVMQSVQTKEGLIISLVKGNIEDTTTEVVVNSVGTGLRLHQGAVSAALSRAAGPQLQVLVDQRSTAPASVGDVIVTEGCNLRNNFVYHVVTPQWDKGQGEAEKVLSSIVDDCLVQAETQCQVSVTFPAIGTGNLQFPASKVSALMLDVILAFSQKRKSDNVQEVDIILHPSDTQTTQAFTNEFNQRFLSQSSPSQAKGPFSKITSPKSGMYQTTVGDICLQICSGDITCEDTDVIINSSNDTFTLNAGVSQAILQAAGPSVLAECQEKGSQAGKAMLLTQPGNLKCRKILHLKGQSSTKMIQKCVSDALKMCIETDMRSVSFPALGTGRGSVDPAQVADAMLDAVADVIGSVPTSFLKLVRIVIFQAPMLAVFHQSMQKRENTETTETPKEGRLSKIMSSIKSAFNWSSSKDDKPTKAFECKVLDPVFFHICGPSQHNVEEVKRWIDKEISAGQATDTITDKVLASLSASDMQHIEDLQEKYQVKISLNQGPSGAAGAQDDQMCFEGHSKDVYSAVKEVNSVLQKIRDKDYLDRQAELINNVVEWSYKYQGQYYPCDPNTNFALEQAKEQNQAQVEVYIEGRVYKASLPNGPAVDSQGNQLKLRRIDKLEGGGNFPENWTAMPANSHCEVILLQKTDAEYLQIEKQFKASCPKSIVKIERIQNLFLWKNYEIRKQQLEDKNGHKNNEKALFHGTDPAAMSHINHSGFNRSYAGKNAAAYGNGTYFAVNASYSANDTYSVPDDKGQKYMYLCLVLTGDFTQGARGMIVPPAKSATSIDLYDSVTDNPSRPTMFVVFHDIQAYPQYLITFK